jgi:hypothetical protein
MIMQGIAVLQLKEGLLSRFYSETRSFYSLRMSRHVFFAGLVMFLLFFKPDFLRAFGNDGPPISITSPDNGTTFPHADIRDHKLIWYAKRKMLVACVTFTDARQNDGTSNDDTHYFDLPGVTFDEAKGVFSATSKKGEVIPVAHYTKMLFLKTIEVLPNATVRIMCPQGEITVILEAIPSNDPAMHQVPPVTDPDATKPVNFNQLFK